MPGARSRRPGDAAPRLVLARRARRLPALLEEPLGRTDPDRRQDGALPRQPPDAAGLRRPRGPQRQAATTTRSASGPTTSPRAPAATSTTTTDGAAACARRALRDRRRPELRPARRRQLPGAIQQLLEHPRINATLDAGERRRGRGGALQGGANLDPPGDPRVRHRRLRRHRARQPARRLRAPAADLEIVGAAVFWPLRADPLSRLTGVFDNAAWGRRRLPDSDHRLVWADLDLAGSPLRTGRAWGSCTRQARGPETPSAPLLRAHARAELAVSQRLVRDQADPDGGEQRKRHEPGASIATGTSARHRAAVTIRARATVPVLRMRKATIPSA